MDETNRALLRQIEKAEKEAKDFERIYRVALTVGLSPDRREGVREDLERVLNRLALLKFLRRAQLSRKEASGA